MLASMEHAQDEIGLQEASELLGISRNRLNELAKCGAIPSRLELSPEGRAVRLIQRSDVLALLEERRRKLEEPLGKGRPPKVPKPD